MRIDNISVENKHLRIHLNWLLFKDKDQGFFVGIIPTLNIAAKSDNFQKLAEELKGMVKNYFSYYTGDKLQQKLKTLGWHNFNPPENVNVPIQFLYCKTDIRVIDIKITI